MSDAGDVRIGFAGDFDESIVQDYFRKRVTWYEQRISASIAVSGRDEFDDRSHIVLASDGRQCLGGLRATVRRPGDRRLLPTEHVCRGLDIPALFPGAGLAARPHAELAKLIVTRDGGALPFLNDLAFRLLHFILRERNPEPDVAYALIAGSRRHARLYEALGRRMDLPSRQARIPRSLIPESYQAMTSGDDATILLVDLGAGDA